jgi:hypothetical protein
MKSLYKIEDAKLERNNKCKCNEFIKKYVGTDTLGNVTRSFINHYDCIIDNRYILFNATKSTKINTFFHKGQRPFSARSQRLHEEKNETKGFMKSFSLSTIQSTTFTLNHKDGYVRSRSVARSMCGWDVDNESP